MSDSCPGGDPDYCRDIVSNPDISGLGVRIAIYVQTILSMCVASLLPYNEKAFKDTSRNSYVVSGSLIIASIIAWKKDQLSLYDGLIVSMLTTIMTAFVTVNGPYIRTLGLSVNISSFLFTAFWCYWGLQIWSNPSNFSFPGCVSTLSTQFVVFGKSLSPTSPGIRGVAIFVFAVGVIAALEALRWFIYWALMYASGNAEQAKENAAMDLARKRDEWRQSGGGIGRQHITPFGGMVGMIYMIVTTEQIAGRNMAPSSREWSFSQTIALVMLAQQIMDCWHYFKLELTYRRQYARRSGRTGP